jgi:hypothetical protein
MSYWWPPTPAAFDPTPRPLSWRWVTLDGFQVRYPDPVDAEIFGIDPNPANINQPAASESNNWNGVWPSGALDLGGSSYNKPGAQSQFRKKGVTQRDRLAMYNWLIDQHSHGPVAEDPPNGGLAPDWIDPATGEVVIQYWDFSEDHPRRKAVHYYPTGHDAKVIVYQWNAAQQKWENEGTDVGKDIINSLKDIIRAFGMITTAIIGYVTGMPTLAAAWANVASISSGAMLSGVPPNLLDFAKAASQYLGTAPGFDGVMADISKSVQLKQGTMGQVGQEISNEISRFGQETTSYIQKLQKIAKDYASSLPKIDLPSAAKGLIPPDIQRAVDNAKKGLLDFDINSYKKALDVYLRGASLSEIEAIRKSAFDKATFDTTYAAAIASSGPGVHAPRIVTGSYGTTTAPYGTTTAPSMDALAAGGSLAGEALTVVGLVGLAGVGFVRFAPNKWQRAVHAPKLTQKQMWIGVGASSAVVLLGLFLGRKRTSTTSPSSSLAVSAGDRTATSTVSSTLRK